MPDDNLNCPIRFGVLEAHQGIHHLGHTWWPVINVAARHNDLKDLRNIDPIREMGIGNGASDLQGSGAGRVFDYQLC